MKTVKTTKSSSEKPRTIIHKQVGSTICRETPAVSGNPRPKPSSGSKGMRKAKA